MSEYKKEAAMAALKMIEKGMVIGLGAGSTIAYLAEGLVADREMADSLTIASSSQDTIRLLQDLQLKVTAAGQLNGLDIYFDSCDQLDQELNAWKSGGGIHATEKILAAMAKEFILLADAGKFVAALDNSFPLTLEVLPEAAGMILSRLKDIYPAATVTVREEGGKPRLTERNNILTDVRFQSLPQLSELNSIKMLPGVAEHSLFFRMASRAVIAGPSGIETKFASWQ